LERFWKSVGFLRPFSSKSREPWEIFGGDFGGCCFAWSCVCARGDVFEGAQGLFAGVRANVVVRTSGWGLCGAIFVRVCNVCARGDVFEGVFQAIEVKK